MKKILTFLGSISIISSTGFLASNVIACGNPLKISELNYNDSKSNSTLINDLLTKNPKVYSSYKGEGTYLEFKLSDDKTKLDENYLNTDSVKLEENLYIEENISLDGGTVDDFSIFKNTFKELTDINESNINGDSSIDKYICTILGKKNESTFKVYVYKFNYQLNQDNNNQSLTYKYETLFYKDIKLN
ncbi:hypothetical protein [Spiroplasma turonicum]|uniref:Lipoprotein n=1 Tax=Spiroplasma turonicum TaxID=216946 RepID=A0A0K1P659_9MOLU|nr:hypothetical protein [Spiroplasma turonicum]AKU79786.1 hypothetical protein STURON_00540 [Spiroplasma turonicum]ALX70804.1 hypothetical protein STURO_v1c05380 [Spiroplasma turonicum]